MEPTKEIAATIGQCIEQLNRQLPAAGQLASGPDAILAGEGGVLDSLGLITLLVSIEQELNSNLGIVCPLLDTFVADTSHPALASVGNLVSWIADRATQDA